MRSYVSLSQNIIFSQNDLPDDLISINYSLLRNTNVSDYMEYDDNVSFSEIITPEKNTTFSDMTDDSSDVSDWTSLNSHPMVNI